MRCAPTARCPEPAGAAAEDTGELPDTGEPADTDTGEPLDTDDTGIHLPDTDTDDGVDTDRPPEPDDPWIDGVADARPLSARLTLTGDAACAYPWLRVEHGDAAGDGDTHLLVACAGAVRAVSASGAGVHTADEAAVGVVTLTYDDDVEGAGDLDGDGVLDLLVSYSHTYTDIDTGLDPSDVAVYRYPGPLTRAGASAAPTALVSERDTYRYPTAGVVGDVDGDGIADVAYALVSYAASFMDFAPAGASTGSASSIGEGGDGLQLLRKAGDVNGDGLQDVAMMGSGLAIFEAPFVASRNFWELESFVNLDAYTDPRALGDVDGDGYDDLSVEDADNAYVLRGPVVAGGAYPRDIAWATIPAPLPVAAAELDGDDGAELLVGSPDADRGGVTETGAVYVLLAPGPGVNELSAADRAWYGAAGDGLGVAITPLPDLDGDGASDIALQGAQAIWVVGGL